MASTAAVEEMALSTRQLEIIALAASGNRLSAIAITVQFSESTVRKELDDARQQLCAETIAAACVIAVRDGLIVFDEHGSPQPNPSFANDERRQV